MLLKELDDNLPDVLVMENVPQVHSNKNAEDFSEWVSFLRKEGYSNFYADMNAKDYGVAQNRERCFMVSILGTYDFNFPEEIPLEKVIDDYLEKDVDEKYFISSEKADKLINSLIERKVLPPIANNRTEQNRTEQNRTEQACRVAVDLSICEPRKIQRANCIKARYNAGISNLQSDGTGVVTLQNELSAD